MHAISYNKKDTRMGKVKYSGRIASSVFCISMAPLKSKASSLPQFSGNKLIGIPY